MRKEEFDFFTEYKYKDYSLNELPQSAIDEYEKIEDKNHIKKFLNMYPQSREDLAELLGVSIHTINSYLRVKNRVEVSLFIKKFIETLDLLYRQRQITRNYKIALLGFKDLMKQSIIDLPLD